MPSDPWEIAETLIAEHGADAVAEVWWRGQYAPEDELPGLLAVLKAIRVLRQVPPVPTTPH